MSIVKAVSKASRESERDGKWANKPEISSKIVGRKPSNIGLSLKEATEKGSIERKRNSAMWRPKKSGGGHASHGVSRGGDGMTYREGGRTPTTRGGGDDRRPTAGDVARAGVRSMIVGGTAGSSTGIR